MQNDRILSDKHRQNISILLTGLCLINVSTAQSLDDPLGGLVVGLTAAAAGLVRGCKQEEGYSPIRTFCNLMVLVLESVPYEQTHKKRVMYEISRRWDADRRKLSTTGSYSGKLDQHLGVKSSSNPSPFESKKGHKTVPEEQMLHLLPSINFLCSTTFQTRRFRGF
jgi:hypothetical protein